MLVSQKFLDTGLAQQDSTANVTRTHDTLNYSHARFEWQPIKMALSAASIDANVFRLAQKFSAEQVIVWHEFRRMGTRNPTP